ncbi:hypothetical protein [Pseudorhodoferax sp.]|uniref:hypothetical protein n=1 Tax=Pseudorhodoferax sp. TaxID=1993553 RepID=UPI002DD64A55|nr:hypothetical protein [Pseudorhodoferax sp.]
MHKPLRFTLLATAVAAISACGGGGGSDDPAPAPQQPTTTPVAIAVMDGALRNAQVCLDANTNDACDAGETQGRTGADGKLTLDVPNADVGKYPVLALVGTDAVDAHSGAVTQAYMMKAPPDHTAVVSPWTTLVELLRRRNHVSTEQAEAVVRDQAALPQSALADYSGAGADNAVLARGARVLVAALQRQLQAMAPQAGQPDVDGVVMTAADVQTIVTGVQTGLIQRAAVAASDSDVVQACADLASAGCGAAVAEAAASLNVATAQNLPEFSHRRRLQMQANAATGAGPALTPGFILDWVNHTDANDWYYRALVFSSAAVVPDAAGNTRYRDERRRNVDGAIRSYAWTGDPDRIGDVHWNGTAWVSCGVDEDAGTNSPRDARGVVARSGNCKDRNVSTNQRIPEDIAGKRMVDVVQRIRITRGDAQNWGPSAATLGDAVFPAGAQLIHQNQLDLSYALAYDARDSALVGVFSAATSAGGDARLGGTPPCSIVANQAASMATSLDILVERYRGTPCLFDQGTFTADGNQISTLAPNAWSGQSTLSIGTIGGAPTGVTPRTNYYTTNTYLRLAFTGPGQVTYYGCRQRWNDGSPRNCESIGTGGYTITTLGDGRVMTLSGEPAISANLNYVRVFVERGGRVYYGYRSKMTSVYLARLNGMAGAALLQQAGMPAVAVP